MNPPAVQPERYQQVVKLIAALIDGNQKSAVISGAHGEAANLSCVTNSLAQDSQNAIANKNAAG